MLPQINGAAFSASSPIQRFLPTQAVALANDVNDPAVVRHEYTDAQLEEKLQAHLSTHTDKKLALLKQYQVSPQFFLTTIVTGLAAAQIVVPDMAKPAVVAYIANTAFSVVAKITDFAIGKLTEKQFAEAINHIAEEGHVAVQNDRMALAIDIEAGGTLSRDQKNRLLDNHQYKSNLSVPQMLGLAIGGGTILALTGTGAAALGGMLTTALGASGASATAVNLGVTAMTNILSGPLLVDFNRHRLGLEQPPGTSLVVGGGFASIGAGLAINTTLPDMPSALSMAARVTIPATISALTSAVLTYARQPLMNGIHRAQAGAATTYATVSDAASRGVGHMAAKLASFSSREVPRQHTHNISGVSNQAYENDSQAMPMNGPFPLLHAGTMPTPFASFSGEDGSIPVSSFVNIPMFGVKGFRIPSPDY